MEVKYKQLLTFLEKLSYEDDVRLLIVCNSEEKNLLRSLVQKMGFYKCYISDDYIPPKITEQFHLIVEFKDYLKDRTFQANELCKFREHIQGKIKL